MHDTALKPLLAPLESKPRSRAKSAAWTISLPVAKGRLNGMRSAVTGLASPVCRGRRGARFAPGQVGGFRSRNQQPIPTRGGYKADPVLQSTIDIFPPGW